MMPLEIDPFSALIWIAIVFVAGFIGYFGKYLSKIVISLFHKRKEEPDNQGEESRPKTKEELDYDLEKKRLKLEKKRLKIEKKKKD